MNDEELTYLINTYSDSVLRLCYSYLKNLHDAQDICQNVFIKLYSLNKKFDDTDYEKAFILHMTANFCKNMLKSPAKKRLVDLEAIKNLHTTEVLQDSIWDIVDKLEEKYRAIIYLHYYEGYKVFEIASIMELKEPTVKTRLARGRKLLKKLLGGNFDE